MGKGSSGARSSGSGATQRPEYISESEKAVRLYLTVEDYTLDREITRQVWVPKSQLAANGWPGEWITDQKAQEFYTGGNNHSNYQATWSDSKGRESGAAKTERELASQARRDAAFNAGVQSYNALIAQAKAAGIKGVRVGLKKATLLKKMRAAGLSV